MFIINQKQQNFLRLYLEIMYLDLVSLPEEQGTQRSQRGSWKSKETIGSGVLQAGSTTLASLGEFCRVDTSVI